MSSQYFTWSGIVFIITGIVIAVLLYLQGGQVIDVGKAVQYNKSEIAKVKEIVERGREERYAAQDLYLKQVHDLQVKLDECLKGK